ncbi:MAG: hypothetical protein AAF456_21710 [Planctomycetota bacterium]
MPLFLCLKSLQPPIGDGHDDAGMRLSFRIVCWNVVASDKFPGRKM